MIWLINITKHIIAQLRWNLLVKSSIYFDSSKKNNEKDPKSKSGDIGTISKYKNIFAKLDICC